MQNANITIFGIPLHLQEYDVRDRLPFALTNDYVFFQGSILNSECMILHFVGEYLSIPRIKVQFQKIAETLNINLPFVLWLDKINPVSRDRLIENGIHFYVNEKIVFLPFLGTRLEESYQKTNNSISDRFSIAAQCVFLWLMYYEKSDCPIPAIMHDLGLSRTTVLRTLQQLFALGLLSEEGKGTRKKFHRTDKMQFWNIGKKRMRNPVYKRLYLEDQTQLVNLPTFSSGEDALAELSAIQHPAHACLAVYRRSIDTKKLSATERLDELRTEQYAIVELWDYDPALFALSKTKHNKGMKIVDVFSLYASFGMLLNDIRIEKELENIIKERIDGQRT